MSDPGALTGVAPAEVDFLQQRRLFPILQDSTYLISNSLGAMPATVRDALAGYADTWAHEGVRSWESDWWMLPETVGDAIGRIIGAPANTVSTHQNVTLASAVLASCFDYSGERNRIVCTELNFPSVIQLYRAQERRGAKLDLVRSPDGFNVATEDLLAAIDERTLLVPISHVIYRASALQDVEAVIARAHEVGAMVALDVYQSAGVMPIDVARLDVDFAVGGVLKWMCGGPGTAYLYVRPDRIAELEPAITGWFARQNAFAFDAYDTSYRDDAWRFLSGTTHIPSLTAALPGVEIVGALDMVAVRAKSLRQTNRIIEGSLEHGWTVRTPRTEARGGHVTVDVPDAQRVAQELLERRIMVDHRPGAGIRLAPHFYTRDDEIDFALETMRALVG